MVRANATEKQVSASAALVTQAARASTESAPHPTAEKRAAVISRLANVYAIIHGRESHAKNDDALAKMAVVVPMVSATARLVNVSATAPGVVLDVSRSGVLRRRWKALSSWEVASATSASSGVNATLALVSANAKWGSRVLSAKKKTVCPSA